MENILGYLNQINQQRMLNGNFLKIFVRHKNDFNYFAFYLNKTHYLDTLKKILNQITPSHPSQIQNFQILDNPILGLILSGTMQQQNLNLGENNLNIEGFSKLINLIKALNSLNIQVKDLSQLQEILNFLQEFSNKNNSHNSNTLVNNSNNIFSSNPENENHSCELTTEKYQDKDRNKETRPINSEDKTNFSSANLVTEFITFKNNNTYLKQNINNTHELKNENRNLNSNEMPVDNDICFQKKNNIFRKISEDESFSKSDKNSTSQVEDNSDGNYH